MLSLAWHQRDIIREVWKAFPNPDSHSELEFQTTGLDGRSSELFLFAVGRYCGSDVPRPHDAPDLPFEREGIADLALP